MDKKAKNSKDNYVKNIVNNINTSLNALLVQFSPEPKKIIQNIQKVSKMLEKYDKEHLIDIIVFPEMAFSGYIFDDRNDIKCCLEKKGQGQTFEFCSNLAKRLEAYVFCGYPEIELENSIEEYTSDSVLSDNDKLYNSAMIIDRKGSLINSYRKHFLYKDDKTWCIEGDEFGYLEILTRDNKPIKLGIGICMDLNPWEFKAPYEKKEFSNFCKDKNVDVIIFLTNWLNATEGDPDRFNESEERSFELLNYWLDRCSPLLTGKTKYFLAANRCGEERLTKFAGSSSIIKLAKRPSLLSKLSIGEENTIYQTIIL